MNDNTENSFVKGFVRLRCLDKDGNERWDTGFIQNLVTTVGKGLITDRLGGVGAAAATYLAVGTSATAPAAGNTTLAAEITTNGLERASATVSQQTTTTANDTLQLYKEWTSTGSHTVEEIGALNAASTGTLLGRALTTTKSVTSGDKLQATYQFRFA